MSAAWRVALSHHSIVTQAAWGGIRLIIGYRALTQGADPIQLGMLASSFALPALLCALATGRIADRFGGPRVFLCGSLTAAAGTIAALATNGLPFLLVASAVIGLGNLMVMVGEQAFVAHISKGKSPESAFGILTAAGSVGQMIGPPTVTLMATINSSGRTDTSLGLLVCLGFNALAIPCYFLLRRTDTQMRATRGKVTSTVNIAGILKAPGLWRSLVVSGAVLVTVDLTFAFVPMWASEHQVGAAIVGLLLALRAGVSVISRLGLTHLINRFGRKSMLIVSIGASVISLIALPLVGPWPAVAVMVGMGLGIGIPQPLTMAWVVSLTAASNHGAVLGLRMTVNRLAQISLPLAMGSLAAPLGVLGIFWANAAVLAGAIAIVAGSDAGENGQQNNGS